MANEAGPSWIALETFAWLSAVPWLLLVVVALPLIFAAARWQTYPTRWMAVLMGGPVLLSLPLGLWPQALVLLAILDTALVVMAAVDFLLLPWSGKGDRRLIVERDIPRTVSINVPTEYEIRLLNRTRYTFTGAVKDDVPEPFSESPPTHQLYLPPMAKVAFRRKVTSHRRGEFWFENVYVQAVSPLRLWKRTLVVTARSRVNVYPDMAQLSEYAILARTNRLSLIGVRRTRRIGQDSDFERLRDYTPDDNYRHIDWRTTARRNKLTVRQYQSDQSQRVMFLLDCGRMMTNERAGMSLLDHSLNAALMMSYVALAQGDAVGMLCFSDKIHAYLPPRGGRNQLNRLLQAGFNQFPQLVESRYDRAFLHLSNHCRRRTLVVMMTNVIDEVNAGQIVDYLGNLVGRHLTLGVLIRDRQLFDAADHPSDEGPRLYQSAVAAEILCWRDQVIRDLRHRGSLVLDVYPEEMTAPLVNEYLQVKAQHLL